MTSGVHLVLGGGYSPPTGSVRLVLQGAAPVLPGVPISGPSVAASWGVAAEGGRSSTRHRWAHNSATAHSPPAALAWGRATGLPAGASLAWGAAGARQHSAALRWNRSVGASNVVGLPWGRTLSATYGADLPWQRSQSRSTTATVRWGRAQAAHIRAAVPWGAAGRLIAPNTFQVPYVPPPPSPVLGRARLRFCKPLEADRLTLRLGVDPCAGLIPGAGTVFPARSAYVQTHTVVAVRLPDMLSLPIESVSMSADAGSVGWTLNADGPASLLTSLAPVAGLPREVRITVDGMTWEFVVEGLRRNRQFGDISASIVGRSSGALLADPYSPVSTYLNTVPMTAQQIVNDVLQFTGVGLDWRVTDWLVPAGAWSHTGSPMSAIRRVAESIGAVVQSPRAGSTVIVAPRYAVLPWNWAGATPDVTFASLDPIIVEGYERADRPAYEGVYVSGQAQGVLVLVRRTGTAPSVVLPLVTDALCTHIDAGRQRGESLLGAAGAQANMTLTLPVLTGVGEPGVIDPGLLIAVPDPAGAWRGVVRSTRVSYSAPVLEQTLTVERHL